MIDVVVLFFLLGLGAGLLRSELKLPAALAHVRERWYDNYAMVAFLHEVEVLRPDKF